MICRDLIMAEVRSFYVLEVENGTPQSIYREGNFNAERERESERGRELLREY